MNLPNIRKMLSFSESQSITDDRTESGFLEPWAQWVSVHTATPSSQHKIKHLGDVASLTQPYIWESLSLLDITSGVWGVMNGARRRAVTCAFFLPDPWTFSENGFPAELDAVLSLPRYLSKNYLHLSKAAIMKKAVPLIAFLVGSGRFFSILCELPRLLSVIVRHGPKHFVFISFFDFVSVSLFTHYKRLYEPSFSIVFLNSIAHLQHHHWTDGIDRLTPPLRYGLAYVDRILGVLFKNIGKEEGVVVMNSLSQVNTNHEKPWILFRQKDPVAFLRMVGVLFQSVEQLMTNDAHVFFDTAEDRWRAQEILKAATIQGRSAFWVENDPQNPLKIFYRVEFSDPVASTTVLNINSCELIFLDLFTPIIERTGRHVPSGSVFSNGIALPPKVYNHEIGSYLVNYFRENV